MFFELNQTNLNFNKNIVNWDALNKLNNLEPNFNYNSVLEVNNTHFFSKVFSNICLGDTTTSTLVTLNLRSFEGSLVTAKKFPLGVKAQPTKLEILFDKIKDESSADYIKTLPDGKLYYPEPFIASPSFLHEEIWFIHILHYHY
jgi:hypothetical protein